MNASNLVIPGKGAERVFREWNIFYGDSSDWSLLRNMPFLWKCETASWQEPCSSKEAYIYCVVKVSASAALRHSNINLRLQQTEMYYHFHLLRLRMKRTILLILKWILERIVNISYPIYFHFICFSSYWMYTTHLMPKRNIDICFAGSIGTKKETTSRNRVDEMSLYSID
jgi:hypothetical protein